MSAIEIILFFSAALIGILSGLYVGFTVVAYINGRTEDHRYGYSKKKSRQIEKQKIKEQKEKAKENKKKAKEKIISQTFIQVDETVSKDTEKNIPDMDDTKSDGSNHHKNLLEERLPENGSYSDFVCDSMGIDPVTEIRKKRKSQDRKYIWKTRKKI